MGMGQSVCKRIIPATHVQAGIDVLLRAATQYLSAVLDHIQKYTHTHTRTRTNTYSQVFVRNWKSQQIRMTI